MGSLLPALTLAWALSTTAGGAEVWFPSGTDLTPYRLSGKIERYTPETLWERIDGEAELYRRFGLSGAAAAYFEVPGDPSRTLEVTIFATRSALDAFGVYAAFRNPSAPEVALGNGGQARDALAVFWHGSTFVHVHADGPDGPRERDLQEASATIARLLGPIPPRPAELARFESLAVPSTVRFQPDHLFGREALPPGLEGTSRTGQRVALSTGSPDAGHALAAYETALRASARSSKEGIALLTGTDPAQGPVSVGVREGRLAAVLAEPGSGDVTELLRALLEDRQ